MQTEVDQEKILDHASWCGKTSPELSAQTKEQTSAQSCKKRSASSAKLPLFLCLTRDGRWQDASTVRGGDWSVAWRVFDAQFWGVPQRRRRIALIADFGGLTAPEILFEREGVSGYYPQGRTPWETATRPAQASAGEAGGGSPPHRMSYCIQGNCIDRADTAGCNGKGWTEDVSYTLNTVDRPAVLRGGLTVAGFKARAGAEADIAYHLEQSPTLLAGNNDATVCIAIENHPNDSRVKFSANNTVQALTGRMGTGGATHL